MQRSDAITDVPGIRVGHWTDRRALTGCTVVIPHEPAVAGVDVRGAAPGTRETELLRAGNLVQHVHAICLAGGSAFGLDAATGVMRFLAARGVGFPYSKGVIPIVPAAILFDLSVGRGDRWPDADAGERAAAAARPSTAQGNVGAGTGATVGKALGPEWAMKGGLGSASESSAHGLVAGALAAVNASGEIVDPDTGATLAGARRRDGSLEDTLTVLREGRSWQPERQPERPAPDRAGHPAPALGESTVLVVVATNAALTKEQANRLATVCHDGLARAVRPAHTQGDGDIVFTLATGERTIEATDYRIIEALATRAVERAIVRGVTSAASIPGIPAFADMPRAPSRPKTKSARHRQPL